MILAGLLYFVFFEFIPQVQLEAAANYHRAQEALDLDKQ